MPQLSEASRRIVTAALARAGVRQASISRSQLACVMLSVAGNDARPTSDSPCPERGRVRFELTWRHGRRRLRRVSGGAGARSLVLDERGLRRRLTHHQLLRPGASVRSTRIRAGALLDAGSAVRRDVSGVWLRRAAAGRGRRLASAIPADGRRHLRPRPVHHVRSRLQRTVRDRDDLFQLHQSRKHVRGVHDDVHQQR